MKITNLVINIIRLARNRLYGVVICTSYVKTLLALICKLINVSLTASNLELTGMIVQRIVIKHHPAGNGHSDPQLVVDRLVLHDPDAGHLLKHLLSRERLQAIDLKLWIPEILEGFG